MTDRLSDLLAERAQQGSGAHPTREGVDAAVSRRATTRRRHRVVAGGIGAAVLLVSVGVGIAATRSSDDDPRSGFTTDPGDVSDLPLIGIDLVGYAREPRLDPHPTPTETDLTYAVFTGDEVDVLGPMMTASLQPGDADHVGTPIDLDLDGDDVGPADGRMVTFPDGAGITWTIDGQQASINGHGVPPEDVIIYAEALVGVPFDLEQMPAPEQLPNRQVVTFGPLPDFPSRTSSYQGPTSVVHVLTTREPGYFDLTRIVSTEGEPYEEIGFESSVLGPGEAILSPDDDGVTSALVRGDAGLTIHAFGTNVDADTLRTAIEQDHLVVLEGEGVPTPTTAPVTTPSILGEPTQIADVKVEPTRITLTLTASDPGFVDTVTVGPEPDPTCDDVEPSLESSAVDLYDQFRQNEGDTRPVAGWVNITLREPQQGWLPGPTVDFDGETVAIACDLDEGTQVLTVPLVEFPDGQTPVAVHQDAVQDPPAVVIDIGS